MTSFTFNHAQLEAAARFIFANNPSCTWPNPAASELDVLNQIVENARDIVRQNNIRDPDNQITSYSTGGYTVIVDDINDAGDYTMSVVVDPAVGNRSNMYVSYEINDPDDD